jgi:hypothetical protein
MTDGAESLVLEHLKKIQAELADSRERDRELLSQIGNLETMMGRLLRDNANIHATQIEDRHAVDALRYRVERIERRLELES